MNLKNGAIATIVILALSVLAHAEMKSVQSAAGALSAADTTPHNDSKCHVRNNTGKDAAGKSCVCTDDPDGDMTLVWVCN